MPALNLQQRSFFLQWMEANIEFIFTTGQSAENKWLWKAWQQMEHLHHSPFPQRSGIIEKEGTGNPDIGEDCSLDMAEVLYKGTLSSHIRQEQYQAQWNSSIDGEGLTEAHRTPPLLTTFGYWGKKSQFSSGIWLLVACSSGLKKGSWSWEGDVV